MIDTIIDISHYQSHIDFDKVKADGIVAIIHKATEGETWKDMEYHDKKDKAKAKGFLWGTYHFSSGGSVTSQVDHFLDYAKPQADELIALDFEPSSSGPNMTLGQAQRFVEMIKTALGRYPVIYGGSMLRSAIGHNLDPILANCPLWYARYASSPTGIPTQVFAKGATLWQYTDGMVGPDPHKVVGIGRCDRNKFNGTEAQLRTQWPFT
ncbi:MAG: glycoside hydrolase family 25 protein [Proteobacteria bacterium]|nr:glycoside hydrolase family 25 protein [Pseudomonadota bacterium]